MWPWSARIAASRQRPCWPPRLSVEPEGHCRAAACAGTFRRAYTFELGATQGLASRAHS